MSTNSQLARGTGIARRSALSTPFNIILALLVLAGLVAWVDQLSQGLIVSNMRDVTSWGLGITGFMFFDGISAGALMLAAGARLFRAEHLRQVELGALIASLVTMVVAAMLIITDLGNPQRLFNLFLYPTTSPMTMDVMGITLYIIFEIIYLWALVQHRESASRVLAAIGLPVAVGVHTIGAMIFAVLVARPFANTALIVPMFLLSALISGLAVVAWVTWWGQRSGFVPAAEAPFRKLAELLALAIPVSLLLTLTDLLTYSFQQATAAGQSVIAAVGGASGWEVWLQIALFLLVFIALCFEQVRQRPTSVLTVSAVALVGVFLERISIMATSFSAPLLSMHPGVPIGVAQPVGTSMFATSQTYYPSLGEWALFLGVVALGVLVFKVLGRAYLPRDVADGRGKSD